MIALIVAVSILVCVVIALHCRVVEANEECRNWEENYRLCSEHRDSIRDEKEAESQEYDDWIKDHTERNAKLIAALNKSTQEYNELGKELRIAKEQRDIAYATIINVRKQVAQ